MSGQDYDQEIRNKSHPSNTLAERVRPIQEQARQQGFVSRGSGDKPMMYDAWGEASAAAEE